MHMNMNVSGQIANKIGKPLKIVIERANLSLIQLFNSKIKRRINKKNFCVLLVNFKERTVAKINSMTYTRKQN